MDAELDRGLLGLLPRPHQRDSAGTELRQIGTWHQDEPLGSSHHLATEIGTQTVSQVEDKIMSDD